MGGILFLFIYFIYFVFGICHRVSSLFLVGPLSATRSHDHQGYSPASHLQQCPCHNKPFCNRKVLLQDKGDRRSPLCKRHWLNQVQWLLCHRNFLDTGAHSADVSTSCLNLLCYCSVVVCFFRVQHVDMDEYTAKVQNVCTIRDTVK